MKKILLSLFFVSVANAQYPNPCSDTETDCYDAATNNTSCTPCWQQYCIVWDLDYGSACDAFCYNASPDICGPERVTFTSVAKCMPDLARCSITYPYLCTLITSETDNCNGELCGQTQGPLYCTNVQPNGQLRKGNRAKTLLARLRALHLVQGS